MTEKELTRVLNTQLATFFGQMSKHFDERFEKSDIVNKSQFERIQQALDGLAVRINDDDQERVAAHRQLDRHEGWIGQLAQNTNTTLAPEQ